MSREEAKKILKRIVDTSNELTHPVMLNMEMEAIKVAIEALSDVPDTNVWKWISVSERLPKEDENVLVTVHFHGLTKEHSLGWNKQFKPSYYVEVANQIDGEWCSYSDEYKVAKDRHEVIAWMPLPEPYKENES